LIDYDRYRSFRITLATDTWHQYQLGRIFIDRICPCHRIACVDSVKQEKRATHTKKTSRLGINGISGAITQRGLPSLGANKLFLGLFFRLAG